MKLSEGNGNNLTRNRSNSRVIRKGAPKEV